MATPASPMPGGSLSWMKWLKFSTIAYGLYALNRIGRFIERLARSPEHPPSLIKQYKCRPSLPIRVFFPKGHDPSSARKYPTLFTIHGGGFILGAPDDNDGWNTVFARTHPVLVIALNYAKAPPSPFPGPVHDLQQLILGALADSSLPIDMTRLATLGWSAGGNLALAVAELPGMRSRIRAAIPIYPVLDFTVPHREKATTRRYKPALGGFRARPQDFLVGLAPVFDWSYVPHHHDLQDPLLSPIFARREDLPAFVFTIACELDMLVGEAKRMICGLAGRDISGTVAGREEPVGKGELLLDDERFSFEERVDGGCYKWLLVPDTIHGFDQRLEPLIRDAELSVDAKLKAAKVQELIGEWLFAGPFAA